MMHSLFSFRNLRTRLTVLYTGLFALTLAVTAIAVVSAVSGSARGVARSEMAAAGKVYDQLWQTRSAQLHQGAAALSQDVGFRQAVATGDDPTVVSALETLRARQDVDGALILGPDAHATSTGLPLDAAALDTLFKELDTDGVESGVLAINGQPFQVVAVPMMSPARIGWVIFAERLDAAQMRNLERLSAIPLSASVGLARTNQRAVMRSGIVNTADGPSMQLERPLPSFDTAAPAALVLTYPLSRAMKPYETLFLALAAIGAAGLGLLLAGTWFLSRGLTPPDLRAGRGRAQAAAG